MRTRISIFILLLTLCLSALAQDGGYTNSSGHFIPSPTSYQMAGQFNRLCTDGMWSHSEHTQGACSYHGGLSATPAGGGGGGNCGKKCEAAVAGAAVGTGIAIAFAVHHAHVVQEKQYCESALSFGDPKCAKFLFDHPVNGVPPLAVEQKVLAQQTCEANPKGKYIVTSPVDSNKTKQFSCKKLRVQ